MSRVMNGDQTVAPDLAARVRDAASKLGYRPNLTASSLRRGDRRTALEIVAPDVVQPDLPLLDGLAQLARAVEPGERAQPQAVAEEVQPARAVPLGLERRGAGIVDQRLGAQGHQVLEALVVPGQQRQVAVVAAAGA